MTERKAPQAAEDLLYGLLGSGPPPESFTMLGREWTQKPGVYPSTLTAGTEVFASALKYPVGGRFLEVGSGTGVIAVSAALAGCAQVTATDVLPEAAENTRVNAERHGVADVVTVRQSDLFDALDPSEEFDVIFWNVPWTWADHDFELRSDLSRAVIDVEYRSHLRFIAEGPDHLAENGRILIGTADEAERAVIDEAAGRHGRRWETVDRIRRLELNRIMEYHIIELLPGR